MKVVITGSESFIGKVLRKHCADKGIEVIGFDTVAATEPGMHQVDIRSAEIEKLIPEGADALIHLAAVSRNKDFEVDPANAFDINVNGTINLMNAAKARNVKQFIFASSEWVYDGCDASVTLTEETPIDITKMKSEYAMSKILGERLLSNRYKEDSCAVTILRFGIVFGPRPKPASAVEGIFNEVRELDELPMNGSLKSGRCFIHVSDISDGIIAAIGQTGLNIFNLGGSKLVTFEEIIEQASQIHGRKPPVNGSNPDALNVRITDNSKARKALKWEPKLDLKAGLSTLISA